MKYKKDKTLDIIACIIIGGVAIAALGLIGFGICFEVHHFLTVVLDLKTWFQTMGIFGSFLIVIAIILWAAKRIGM